MGYAPGIVISLAPLVFLSLATANVQDPAKDLDRHIYPLATPKAAPSITLDVEDSPESRPWGERAVALARTWYPAVVAFLATENYTPAPLKIVIKKEISAPAYAGGGEITVNGKWIKEHPDDFGMVIHELVHIVQAYPGSDKSPGWLVEGIADYIRWWRYEPEAPRPRLDKAKASYRDSYRTTGYFLAWTSRKYHMGLVPALDRAMKKREDAVAVFKSVTGKDVDELWTEFLASLP